MAGHTPTRWVTGIFLITAIFVALLSFLANDEQTGFFQTNSVTYLNVTWANLSTTVDSIGQPNNTVISEIYGNQNESLESWQDAETVSYGALSYWDKMVKALAVAVRSLTGIGEMASSVATPAGEATGLTDSAGGQVLMAILMVCLVTAIIFMILRAMTGRDL